MAADDWTPEERQLLDEFAKIVAPVVLAYYMKTYVAGGSPVGLAIARDIYGQAEELVQFRRGFFEEGKVLAAKQDTAVFVQSVTVLDPDTGEEVELEIHKLGCGGMVGLDASFLEDGDGPAYSPYNPGTEIVISADEH